MSVDLSLAERVYRGATEADRVYQGASLLYHQAGLGPPPGAFLLTEDGGPLTTEGDAPLAQE